MCSECGRWALLYRLFCNSTWSPGIDGSPCTVSARMQRIVLLLASSKRSMVKPISRLEIAAYGIGYGLLGSIALIVLWFAYLGPKQDREARAAADAFCSSLPVGKDASHLAYQAGEASAQLLTWPPVSGTTRHQARFSGFLANVFVCEVRERDGRISGKYREEHTW